MRNAHDTYLGWSQPSHAPGCKRPVWEIDTRIVHDAWLGRNDGVSHSCANDDCEHGDHYTALTVRLVCRSCTVAHLFCGGAMSTETTNTATLGYGQPPRKAGGLWLHPGPPLLGPKDGPDDYLCTLQEVQRVRREDVVGIVGQGRGRRGAVRWGAAAVPELDKRRPGAPMTYRFVSGKLTFRSVGGAATWVREQVLAAAATPEGTAGAG